MDRIWNFLIDIIIAILIMFASVTIYFGFREETMVKSMLLGTVDDFITDVRKNGYITLNNYENLYDKLSVTKEIYDITLEHTDRIWEPEYRRKTLQEILDAQNAAYTGGNVYIYREVITQKPTIEDPVNNTKLNTETNESVLASAVKTPASAEHVHSNDCYNATVHIHTGSATQGGGCYGEDNVPGDICGETLVYDHTVIDDILFQCSICGGTCKGQMVLQWYYCCNKHTTTRTLVYYWKCDQCGCSFNKEEMDPVPATCQKVESSHYNLSCGKIEGHYYNGDVEVQPECDHVVTSIAPTHPNQTLYIGDNIISTALATYLDGSTDILVCDVSGYDKNKPGTQTVALSYSGLVNSAKTTGTKISMVTVNLIPKNKSCTKGHIYNLNSDGSDPGCPYCKAWVESLKVIYPSNSSMEITIGTTLQDNGVKLLATYMDGHTEILTNEYLDNLDTKYHGTSNVTIGYKGVTTQMRVTTECAKMTCLICGNTYNLYPDKSDPGCPYCLAKTPVFTGNVMEYEENFYTEDILKSLYKNKQYKLNQDDMFTITLKNKSSNIGRKLLQKILPLISDQWIYIKKSTKVCSN